MIIYYSNMGSATGLRRFLPYDIPILTSFYGCSFDKIEKPDFCSKLFLDSGAFSAFRQGKPVDIDKYIEYVKKWDEEIEVYAGLDVIGDQEATWENVQYMVQAGLNPLPTFHYGEDFEYLEKYCQQFEYIAIGGIVPIKSRDLLTTFLDKCFSRIPAETKVHGFGVGDENMMENYPWFSVDASSVHMLARFGGIYTPWGIFKVNPEVKAHEIAWMTLRPGVLEQIKSWVADLGIVDNFEVLQAQDTTATASRCSVSVMYFERIRERIEAGGGKLRKIKIGFDLV